MNVRLVDGNDPRARLEQLLAPPVVDALMEFVDAIVELRLAERDAAASTRTWLTLEEAGEQLGCSADAVRMRVKRGRLEAKTQGRRVYVSAASVERLEHAA